LKTGNALLKTAGLVARFDKKQALKLTEDLAQHLTTKGVKVFIEDTLKAKLSAKEEFVPLGQMKTNMIITIGGDGTILRTCAAVPKPEPPILAVNMGVRGFLTEVEPKRAIEAVDKCLKGEYKLEKCMKLAATADGAEFPDALNEIVVTHDEPAKLLYTRILKDGKPILTCQADSLLVSTQTGSTGYSLSAGGPVLDPGVGAFVLTPICPLTDFRPIVFPADSSLTIEVLKPKRMLVLVDGQHMQLVRSKKPSITVTRSKFETRFVRFGDNFYDRLQSRLLFRGTG
jgi:NAD+ kinase